MMKTDKSVWMGFTSHHPRVETWGYSDLVNDVIQINPQIHLWDDETPHAQIPISVSTDFLYPKTDESVRMMDFASYPPRVETRGYSDEPLFHFRKELFSSGRQSFSSGKQSFCSGKELFTCGKQSFSSGKELFRSRKELFCSGKPLFCSIVQPLSLLAQPFTVGREIQLAMEQSK